MRVSILPVDEQKFGRDIEVFNLMGTSILDSHCDETLKEFGSLVVSKIERLLGV